VSEHPEIHIKQYCRAATFVGAGANILVAAPGKQFD
jgi:hypothetical protein